MEVRNQSASDRDFRVPDGGSVNPSPSGTDEPFRLVRYECYRWSIHRPISAGQSSSESITARRSVDNEVSIASLDSCLR